MKSQTVLFDLRHDIAHITLDRPAVGNALSASMVDDLSDSIDRALDGNARMLVLRGNGKHLCTGFDLSDLEACSDGDLLLRFVRIEELLQKVYNCPIVTVAVGNGRVFGAGADLFASCDRRLCPVDASFAFPGTGFGLVLGTRRLGARLGNENARRLLLDGGTISANDALKVGLVTGICQESEIAGLLQDYARSSTRLSKATIANIHAVTISSDGQGDLAALVRSASVPGLKDRIVAYRASLLQQRQQPTTK